MFFTEEIEICFAYCLTWIIQTKPLRKCIAYSNESAVSILVINMVGSGVQQNE